MIDAAEKAKLNGSKAKKRQLKSNVVGAAWAQLISQCSQVGSSLILIFENLENM